MNQNEISNVSFLLFSHFKNSFFNYDYGKNKQIKVNQKSFVRQLHFFCDYSTKHMIKLWSCRQTLQWIATKLIWSHVSLTVSPAMSTSSHFRPTTSIIRKMSYTKVHKSFILELLCATEKVRTVKNWKKLLYHKTKKYVPQCYESALLFRR